MYDAISLNDFKYEKECVYKDEHYAVRDNGAVLRYSLGSKRARPTDNQWTFGKLNANTGYLEIASVPVHRIVATAYKGDAPGKDYVVDHIDTNKRNNRPDNLRWVTRLENIILNPITAKRIALVCGSVEAFLADPVQYREMFQETNWKWMRAVSTEEAEISRTRLLAWAESDKSLSGGSLDEWIFRRPLNFPAAVEEFIISKTPNAVQQDWKVPSEFPCCPLDSNNNSIISYKENLEIGAYFPQTNM